jgi:hypothetical protein
VRQIGGDGIEPTWYKNRMRSALLSAMALAFAQPALGEGPTWKAGVAKVRITPDKPLWMTGYGSRTKASTGTIQELHAKALALDDGTGRPAVLVSADLLGFPAAVARNVTQEAEKRYGLRRDRLILSCTHTHCGPALAQEHRMLYGARASPEECRDIEDYTRQLEGKVVGVIGSALKELGPAQLRFASARAEFAVNRRLKTEKGYVIDVDPQGPVDHGVPLLAVESQGGNLVAIVFGYACHNTTVGGDCYQFHGDYAGFAQESLERQHPQAIALFIQGCGADANPAPRGTIELARQHGEALAGAVETALRGPMQHVTGPLKSACQVVRLAFDKPPSRETLEAQLEHKDLYRRWQAQELLKTLERDGRLPSEYPYPLQVWQFGRDLTLVAMAGEVVVDYGLRLKKELGPEALWIAGYCNDVFAYIPSLRVLREGGYEAADAMIYYVQPGPFAPSVEEVIIGKTREMVEEVRAR